jgi:hypothetical protein
MNTGIADRAQPSPDLPVHEHADVSHGNPREDMSFLKFLFRWKRSRPAQRIRICVECGMPIAEHKEWCSILRSIRENPALANSNNPS